MDIDMYGTICKDRFESINHDIELLKQEEILPMRDTVNEVREKVFNGLGHMPRKMNWLIALFVTVLAGLGTIMWTASANQGRMETLLDVHTSQTEAMVRQVIAEVQE